MRKLFSTLSLLSLLGCNSHSLKSVEIESNLVPEESFVMDIDKRVDILFVIDNSYSMAEEQAKLAENFGTLIQGLENEGVSYRIGVTTTDLDGKYCNPHSPTGGKLRSRSCLDVPGEFQAQTIDGFLDRFTEACENWCSSYTEDLELQNPWIEYDNGVTNFNTLLSSVEVFQCLGPQGISGCGAAESPLESARRFLNSDESNEFLRPDALFSLVILTDEVDCSTRYPSFVDRFETPWMSSVCWEAGVECNGGECFPKNYDIFGNSTENLKDAVLYPVEEYVDFFQMMEKVSVSIIAGVPEGYPDLPISYTFDNDISVSTFGVDPGCSTLDGQTAVPPVRMKKFVDDVGGGLYSVCSESYDPVIAGITEKILKDLPPACFGSCVLDTKPSTPELDYSCVVSQGSGLLSEEIPECVDGELSEGEDVCWEVLIGEERNEKCQENEGQNVEFILHRRPGVPVNPESQINVFCESSTNPSIDCG